MFVIHDRKERLAYWQEFWAAVSQDVDEISSTEVYPLYPTSRYVRPGMRILEAGVGMGRVMKHYVRNGHEVVGMDYEPQCIRRLSEQNPNLQLYVGDVNRLPDPDSHYDAVLAFGTLSNLPDPDRALMEFYRVLKPGGLLVASVTNDNLMRRLLVGLSNLKGGPRHFSMVAYTPGEWGERLEKAGFRVQELAPIITRLPLFTYFPFLRRRGLNRIDWTVARDGDKGLALNSLGEWVFQHAFKTMPFVISHGVVGVAYRP